MKPIEMCQDNKSAIQIELNGSRSCKQTKHMELRYFRVVDQVKHGTMVPVYCNTNDMLADVLTKPLQGSQFGLLRDFLLNRGTNEKKRKNTCEHER